MSDPSFDVEYSFAEGVKRHLRLLDKGVPVDLDQLFEQIGHAVLSASENQALSDVPEELILSIVFGSRLPDFTAIKDANLIGIYVFTGMLLASLIHSKNLTLEAPVEPITSEDLDAVKAELDQVYAEKEERVMRELEAFREDLFGVFKTLSSELAESISDFN